MDLPGAKLAKEEMERMVESFKSNKQQQQPYKSENVTVSQMVMKLEEDYKTLLEENFRMRQERTRILEILLPLKMRSDSK